MLITIILLSFVSTIASGTTTDTEWEYTQKAKIIRYLAETVSWPTGSIADDAVNVCVFGKLDNMKVIESINGSMINKRKLAIKAISNLKKAQDNCQIVYVLKSEEKDAQKIIKAFNGKPVLLLGDMDHFAQDGGSMNFVVVRGLVALTINIESLKNSNLSFDMKTYSQITVIPSKEDLKESK
jgi:hypothetical protein